VERAVSSTGRAADSNQEVRGSSPLTGPPRNQRVSDFFAAPFLLLRYFAKTFVVLITFRSYRPRRTCHRGSTHPCHTSFPLSPAEGRDTHSANIMCQLSTSISLKRLVQDDFVISSRLRLQNHDPNLLQYVGPLAT